MRDLNYQLKQLCARNRDGSYSTQANRQRILDLVARLLNTMGFTRMSAHSLKRNHVDALLKHWMPEGIVYSACATVPVWRSDAHFSRESQLPSARAIVRSVSTQSIISAKVSRMLEIMAKRSPISCFALQSNMCRYAIQVSHMVISFFCGGFGFDSLKEYQSQKEYFMSV
jgi:hypothetical protein